MNAYDPEHHIVHVAPSQRLVTYGGDVVGEVLAGPTDCGLNSAGMLRDVDVGPDAFTYTECAACTGP